MAGQTKIIKRAFNAGETSKAFKWRNDTEKHGYSCEKLENFYVNTLGGITRRSGTKLLDVLGYDNTSNIRLVPFEYRRDFSHIWAFYSNAVESIRKWESEPFELPCTFSIAVIIPQDVKDSLDIWSKGTLKLKLASKKLTVVYGENEHSCAENISTNQFNFVVFIYRNGKFSLFLNEVEVIEPTTYEFLNTSSALIFHPLEFKGYNWGLSAYDFDMSSEGAPYTINDFQNSRNITLIKPLEATGTHKHASISADSSGIVSITSEWELHRDTEYDCIYDNIFGAASENSSMWAVRHDYEFPFYVQKGSTVKIPSSAKLRNVLAYLKNSKDSSVPAYILSQGGPNEYIQLENIINALTPTEANYNPFPIEEGIVSTIDNQSSPYYTGPINVQPRGDKYSAEVSDSFVAEYDYDTIVFITKENSYEYAGAYSTGLTEGGKTWISDNDFGTYYVPEDEKCIPVSDGFGIAIEGHSLIGDGIWTIVEDKTLLDVYTIDGEKIIDALEVSIPPSSIPELQYKQVGGAMFIVHSGFKPLRFDYNGENIVCTNAVYIEPSLDEALESVIISYGDAEDTSELLMKGTEITISSNIDLFRGEMIGSQIKVEYSDNCKSTYNWKPSESLDKKVSAMYAPLGEITVRPEGGVWDGILLLEESIDGGVTWSEIGRTTAIQGSVNTEIMRETYHIQSIVRARMKEQNIVEEKTGEVLDECINGCMFNIFTNATCCAWMEILSIENPRKAKVKLLNPARAYIRSTAAYQSAWSNAFGFPRTVDIHDERLVLAGTELNPSTVWLSQTNNWDNFRSVSNLDTDPLSYTLASDDGEPVSWLVSRQDLMIGLGTSEWSLGSRDAGQALTASIVHAANQSEDGVEYIMPTKAGGMVIYVRRGNREVGSISYDFASDSYNSISLTTMNPEIIGDGFVTIFNQLSPRNQIFAVRKDGVVAVFAYDKENNVAAWSRFLFGNGVVSACAVSTGDFRSIFLVVKRDGHLCLERMDSNEQKTENWLDCVPISESVQIPEDLETSVNYQSLVKTTPVFLEGNIRVLEVKMYLLNSFGGRFRIVGFNQNGDEALDDWREILSRESEFLQNPQPRDYRYTGTCDTGYLEEGSIEISTDFPAPFELTAIGINAKG